MLRITCKQSTELISQAQDRRLSKREHLVLHMHLLLCRPCSRFKRQLEQLRVIIHRLTHHLEMNGKGLPAAAKARIQAAINKARNLR